MIYVKTFLNCFRLVIITKHQFLSTGITNALNLRCCMYNMISSTTFQAGTSSGHTVYNIGIRNIHIDCIINFTSQFVQSLC